MYKIFLIDFQTFIYIWLFLFFFLLFLLIYLIRVYYKKKKSFNQSSAQTVIEDISNEIVSEITKIQNRFMELVEKKDIKSAIIESYTNLSKLFLNHLKIQNKPYYTEKEMVEEVYIQDNKLIAYRNYILNLYQIYEKYRFGDFKVEQKDLEDFKKNLLELLNYLSKKYGKY